MTSRAFAHAVFLARSTVESAGGYHFCIYFYFLHYYFCFIGYMFDDAKVRNVARFTKFLGYIAQICDE